MTVEGADERSERLQRRRRADVGIDVGCRRVVLDRRVFIFRAGASGALQTRRDVGQTKQRALRRPRERAAERFRVPDQFFERGAVLIARRRRRPVALRRRRMGERHREQPEQHDAVGPHQRPRGR